MNRTVLFIFLVITFSLSWAQKEQGYKIIKANYISYPISQFNMTEESMKSSPSRASLYEFMKGITKYYSLYINLKDNSSIYELDSTIQKRPLGWESPKIRVALTDSLHFALKSPKGKTYKHEWVMNQTFFSEGEVGNIEWKLTNEKKIINGLNCFKATAKADNYPMLTVWYTKDIPVSNGPSIFQGLPGLIVWAEDYFGTTQLLSIKYNNNLKLYDNKYRQSFKEFTFQKEKRKHYDKEPILIIKKSDLAKSLYKSNHGKNYKG